MQGSVPPSSGHSLAGLPSAGMSQAIVACGQGPDAAQFGFVEPHERLVVPSAGSMGGEPLTDVYGHHGSSFKSKKGMYSNESKIWTGRFADRPLQDHVLVWNH